MTEFLLFCILLCLCKPLRTFLAAAFWILLFLVVWIGRVQRNRPRSSRLASRRLAFPRSRGR
jgi:hypothetical protein